MDAEKLVDDIVQVLSDGGWTPNTYVKKKAVALLTRAIEEETQALLCSEQIEHNKIAEICFAVGAETPDGTSTGAVNNLADKYNALRAQVAELLDALGKISNTSPGPMMMNMNAKTSDPWEKKMSNNHQIIARRAIARASCVAMQ